jgi:plasmid stability protein
MVNEAPKRGRGRPPAPERERRGENLTLRVRAETKAALERRAAKSGRSLSGEAETWLGQGLLSEGMLDQALDLAFGHQTAGVILLLGRIVRETASSAGLATTHALEGANNWLSNPYAFDQVYTAIVTAMEALRPDGKIDPPLGSKADKVDLGVIFRDHLGLSLAEVLLNAVADRAGGADLVAWGAQIRTRLGPQIVERIKEHLAMLDRLGDRNG